MKRITISGTSPVRRAIEELKKLGMDDRLSIEIAYDVKDVVGEELVRICSRYGAEITVDVKTEAGRWRGKMTLRDSVVTWVIGFLGDIEQYDVDDTQAVEDDYRPRHGDEFYQRLFGVAK